MGRPLSGGYGLMYCCARRKDMLWIFLFGKKPNCFCFVLAAVVTQSEGNCVGFCENNREEVQYALHLEDRLTSRLDGSFVNGQRKNATKHLCGSCHERSPLTSPCPSKNNSELLRADVCTVRRQKLEFVSTFSKRGLLRASTFGSGRVPLTKS